MRGTDLLSFYNGLGRTRALDILFHKIYTTILRSGWYYSHFAVKDIFKLCDMLKDIQTAQ